MPNTPFLAVDVGNARIKLGLFGETAVGLPEPQEMLPVSDPATIGPWLAERVPQAASWWIASVNRALASRLIDWIRSNRPADRVVLLASGDVPLTVRLERPDMVGIDRLVDAVAVNRLRRPDRPAVIVDVGSAITVDLVSSAGDFLGGAILPGLGMSARALHEFTDMLPWIDASDLNEPPPVLGTATVPAIASGLFWGTVGAVRELAARLTGGQTSGQRPVASGQKDKNVHHGEDVIANAELFLTGGAGASVAELLGPDCRFVPHLTLAGIAVTAMQQPASPH